jgi:uroporphyrinogen decarboxylase
LDTCNPVQITCAGMNPRELKSEFGDRFAFWGGGCDTRFVLRKSTPQEIREHVREQIEIFKPGGGFIFQQVHNILADVPPENIVALLDAAHEFG